MSNAVPDGWSIKSLNGHMEILSGFPFKSSLFCDDSSQIGMIRIRDLLKQNIETFYAGDFDEEYIVERGDILIGMDGDFNIVKWKAKDALLNQRICKIKAFPNKGFDTDFLFHSLVEDLDSIHAATGATTVKHLSVKDIRGIEKAYPPLPEQQKIAAILSSVDDVIEKTRAQIDKLKDLKTGMMQELLTKGIGHTAFKDSPVGRIPEGWDVYFLGDLADFINGNGFKSSDWSETGLPIIRIQNLNGDGSFNYFNKEVNPKWIVETGDLLFAWSGQRGKSFGARIWKGKKGVLNQHIFRVSVNDALVTKQYLHLLMQQVQVDIERHAHGFKDSFMHVKKSDLVGQEVAIPRISEQEKIVSIMDSLSERLELSQAKLTKFQESKKALMQDLLTGKVRVNVDNKETAVA